MNLLLSFRRLGFFSVLILITQLAEAQFLMDMIDTTKEIGRGVFSMYKKFDHIRISGYIQPQFQWASQGGIISYEGGVFPPNTKTRFMLRRGRIRFDYAHFDKQNRPQLQFVFQFDGTERGVNIRDFWGRLWENKWQRFVFTTGMFARPFGFEVNLSSQDRESPERGRMSQTLMRTERDLGAMISYEPRAATAKAKWLKIDAGIFNGQGLSGNTEFDTYKDFITQVMIRPISLPNNLSISGGISYLNGGLRNNSKYVYEIANLNGLKQFVVDSSESNIGTKAPRIYHGANLQLKKKLKWGYSELRAEYWWGTQTATQLASETPGSVLTELGLPVPYYIRNFNGAFFYFLQNIINNKHQLGIKYDWYDPNTHLSGQDIGKAGSHTGWADIKYSCLGLGYLYYMNENVKLVLWYSLVHNEETQLAGYTEDVKDNVLTCRLQFRF